MLVDAREGGHLLFSPVEKKLCANDASSKQPRIYGRFGNHNMLRTLLDPASAFCERDITILLRYELQMFGQAKTAAQKSTVLTTNPPSSFFQRYSLLSTLNFNSLPPSITG